MRGRSPSRKHLVPDGRTSKYTFACSHSEASYGPESTSASSVMHTGVAQRKLGTNKCPWQIRRGDAYRHYFAAKLGNARSRTSPPSSPEWVQCGDHIESPVNSGHLVLGSSPHKVAGREIWRKMFWPLATLLQGIEPVAVLSPLELLQELRQGWKEPEQWLVFRRQDGR